MVHLWYGLDAADAIIGADDGGRDGVGRGGAQADGGGDAGLKDVRDGEEEVGADASGDGHTIHLPRGDRTASGMCSTFFACNELWCAGEWTVLI